MANNYRTNDEHRAFVTGFLSEKLPTTTPELRTALITAENAYLGILQARVEAQAKLFNERQRFLHPKDKELTDMDRKIHLDANTSDIQAEYELLAGLEEGLQQRIEVIKTIWLVTSKNLLE